MLHHAPNIVISSPSMLWGCNKTWHPSCMFGLRVPQQLLLLLLLFFSSQINSSCMHIIDNRPLDFTCTSLKGAIME